MHVYNKYCDFHRKLFNYHLSISNILIFLHDCFLKTQIKSKCISYISTSDIVKIYSPNTIISIKKMFVLNTNQHEIFTIKFCFYHLIDEYIYISLLFYIFSNYSSVSQLSLFFDHLHFLLYKLFIKMFCSFFYWIIWIYLV